MIPTEIDLTFGFPIIATAFAGVDPTGFPPTKETVGANVYPSPDSSTTIPETLPFEIYALALAPVPSPEITTFGGVV